MYNSQWQEYEFIKRDELVLFRKRDKIARRVMMSLFGVLICGVGVGLFKFASFGVDPFQSLMGGLSCVLPISFGTLYVIANIVLLMFSVIFDRTKIGLATLINLFLLGYVVDYSYRVLISLFPNPSMGARVAVLIIGLAVLAISCSMYFTADLGVSTYDAIALVLNQKFPKIPFKFYRIATDIICLTLGVTLFFISKKPMSDIGQVVGVGTVVTACCLGPLIDWCNNHVSNKMLNYKSK